MTFSGIEIALVLASLM